MPILQASPDQTYVVLSFCVWASNRWVEGEGVHAHTRLTCAVTLGSRG